MFRTYKAEEGKILQTPTYYINNQTETIMAEESWTASNLFKYEFPGYLKDMFCENEYRNMDV